MDIFYFPRGRDSFPPKFHLIPPRNFFFPTWKIKILHLDISKYPRGESVSSDIVPYQYVVGSKLMRQPWISGGVFGLLRYSSYLCRYKRPRSGAVVARWAHNPKVTGSSPVSATMIREVSFPTRERHLFFLIQWWVSEGCLTRCTAML